MREFDGEVLGFARPMKREQTALGGVLLSALVFVAGQGLIGTLVGVSAHDHGFSNAVIGLIGSAYYVGFIAGCWCGPAAILRFGHQTIFMAILLFAAVIMSVFAFWAVPSAWIAARAALGFIAAIAYTLIESWLNHLAVNRNRGRVFGSYLLIKQLGSSLGQTIILLANVVPWAMFAAAALLFAIAWIPIRAASPPVPSIAPERTRPRPIELLLAAPIGTLICAAAGLANGAIWTLSPVFGVAHGFPRALAGAFMGSFILGGAIIQYPLGWVSDRMDRRTLVVCASVAAAAIGAWLATMSLGAPHWVVLITMLVFGMAVLSLYGLGVSLVNDAVLPADRVQTAAALLFLNSLASAVSPIAAGVLTDRFDIGAVYWYTATVHAGIALFAFAARGSNRIAVSEAGK
jgi:MFS family permease